MDFLGDGSRYGVSISYSIENAPPGPAGAVKLLQPKLADTFVVISGDLITDLDLTAAVRMHKSVQSAATILLHKTCDPSQFGMVECSEDGRVTRLIEKPKLTEISTDIVNTGIYVLEPEVLSSIAYNTVQDFATNLFPRMLGNQDRVFGFEIPGYWCDIGDLLQYRNAHFDALQGEFSVDLPAVYVGEGIWAGGGVDIHPTAQLSSPIYVGAGASIGCDARIGRHTVIGAGAVVEEGASVARSVIGAGAQIGRETEVTDCIVRGGYLITETEPTAVKPEVRAARQFAPANPINKTAFAQETLA